LLKFEAGKPAADFNGRAGSNHVETPVRRTRA
jgi:hypothetical protein